MVKEIVTAETNLSKKARKSPVPQDGKRILEGALKLRLDQRVALINSLTTSIDNELKYMEDKWNEAKKLINGQS